MLATLLSFPVLAAGRCRRLDGADAAVPEGQQREAHQLQHGVRVVVQHVAQAVVQQQLDLVGGCCHKEASCFQSRPMQKHAFDSFSLCSHPLRLTRCKLHL